MGEIVKYNNKMNNMPLKNFEKNDLDFFYAICSKVKNKGSEIIEIPFKEIKSLTKYEQAQIRFISDLDRMNKKLINCSGRFENNDEIVYFNLFSTFRIIKSREVLKIRVNADFIWLLNDIAKEFTSFELQEYVSLDYTYSKGLYRLLKQWKTKGKTPMYKVDEFKELLSTPNYTPKDIMKEIINPAIDDINKHKAFKNLRCEVIYARKRGRPVEGYIFHFDKDDLKGQIEFRNSEELEEIVCGMSKEEINKTLKIAADIQKGNKTGNKNKFNKFTQRSAPTAETENRYIELLEKDLLGIELTQEEKEEYENIARLRN